MISGWGLKVETNLNRRDFDHSSEARGCDVVDARPGRSCGKFFRVERWQVVHDSDMSRYKTDE